MSIAEGQALQDQRDLDQQLKTEERGSQGRKPRDETKGRRCGRCGRPGHNARTCSISVESSGQEHGN